MGLIESGAKPGMLAPYRVLDLTDEKGLYAGYLLGSLGADVIKVERPGGDAARNIGPFVHDIPDPEKSLFWLAYNANKRGITLNLEKDAGRELFRKLVLKADVVIESFRPGYLDELGLGYHDLAKVNPRIVLASISPFGQTGPRRDYKGSDLISWAMGGLLAVTGDSERPPVAISHIPFAYLMAGCDAAWSATIAIYWRGVSGKGQNIDVSIQESVVRSGWTYYEAWKLIGKDEPRGSSRSLIPGTDLFLQVVWPAKDGYVRYRISTGGFGKNQNESMVKWLDEEGLADDFIRGINWLNYDWRSRSQAEIDRIHAYMGRLFPAKTRAELAAEALRRGIMLESVNTPADAFGHPQLQDRLYWQEVVHPELGMSMLYPGRSCLPSDTACGIACRAPHIGEHNRDIYRGDLGLSDEIVDSLKGGGTI
jgi:crotonobetainyl-CoA:carnitine CoA-transferase CaiB-like acyl-CoA transferase